VAAKPANRTVIGSKGPPGGVEPYRLDLGGSPPMRISAVTALLFVGVACLPEAGLLSGAELAGACQVGAETSWDAHIGPLADGWEPTSPIWPGATGRFLVYEGRATADGQDTTGGRFAVCEDLDGCTTDGWHLALGDGWLEL